MTYSVVKRGGMTEEFDQSKIETAIEYAFDRDIEDVDLDALVDCVLECILDAGKEIISTEEINDYAERCLMNKGYYDEARNFILYREQTKNIRKMSTDNDTMSQYIFQSRYSRYLPRKRRRETWNETVDRVRDMHIQKYPKVEKDIIWAFEQVRQKVVLPSMRSMQFGGAPILNKHARMYNCTYSAIDRMDFYSESMYLLLCGCGVGFSVEFSNIDKLPELKTPSFTEIVHHTIEDSIEGWADAVKVLMNSYVEGYTVEFIYKKVRKQGVPIKSGGKAPGHIPLRRALENIRAILDGACKRETPKLKTIEAYDIVMHISDAVLSGGVRRSATICLFSPDDIDMMTAKTGNWFEENPQRGRSNNSAKLVRSETTKEQFMRIFETQKEFGEPGFYFVNNTDTGTNPCCEIGLNPYLPEGYVMPDGEVLKEKTTGFQFCNLTTINGATLKSSADFENAIKAATIIGTCQAGFNEFDYLTKYTNEICRRESLLGVSITGMMDAPDIALNPELQREMALLAVECNKKFAKKIGIPQAARVTCVKPEGTSSILLNTASGIHPRFAPRYFRRIQANVHDPVYQHFKEQNPHCCEPSVYSANQTDDVITFCVKSPDGAITKDDLTALEFLQKVKSTQENWVIPGTARPDSTPELNHNVSNTITVKPHEWDAVRDFIYDNRELFTGISLIPDDDSIYQQAPHQQVLTDDDEARWSNFLETYEKIDYTTLNEEDDQTEHKQIVACGGNNCEIK
jgi:ribonucleoside-diphosphate reductase alpha chain